MMSEAKEDPKTGAFKKLILPLLFGGIFGFLLAKGVFSLGDTLGDTGLSTSANVAVLSGAFYVMMGIFVGIGTLVPNRGAKVLNVEDADELREEPPVLLFSSIAMALWGVALIVLALSGGALLISSGSGLAIASVLYAVGIYFAIRCYKLSDELMMAVNREAASWSYGLVLAALGGWSALAHAGFLEGPQPLDILTVFYAMVLLATYIACGRRGMLKTR